MSENCFVKHSIWKHSITTFMVENSRVLSHHPKCTSVKVSYTIPKLLIQMFLTYCSSTLSKHVDGFALMCPADEIPASTPKKFHFHAHSTNGIKWHFLKHGNKNRF